jgi:uncharacterized protein GlcG (DUF336 family)
MFFSEEKNQKTFNSAQAYRYRPWPVRGSGGESKSFLLLFFKKEVLPSFGDIIMTITLDQANKIAFAALDAGKREDIAALTVVVTDMGGCVRSAMRADGVGNFGFEIALAKASTALGFGMSSAAVAGMLGSNQGLVTGIVGATGGRFLPLGGGILIRDAAGALLGAVAVAGSLPENDERFAAACVLAAGLVVGG